MEAGGKTIMAYYLVQGRVEEKSEGDLKDKVRHQAFLSLKPFGKALSFGLENARIDEKGAWLWEEEDYCNPPLKQEREAVFDQYFSNIKTQKVAEGEGWKKIKHLPRVFPR
jgi:hypothetical protein